MSIIVSNIRLPIDCREEDAIESAIRTVGAAHVITAKIHKKAIDARHKEVRFVYAVRLDCNTDEEALASSFGSPHIVYSAPVEFQPKMGTRPLQGSPVICGFGPAGIFAGLLLAQYGFCPVIFERGPKMHERSRRVEQFWNGGGLDPTANVQFGEGGAGTFSDGKLTTRINDPLCRFVLEAFCQHGGPEDILYLAKPHIGTDRLKDIIIRMREEIERLGGRICFQDQICDIDIKDGKIAAVESLKQGKIETEILILAVGHSARDTYEMLFDRGVAMAPKPFSVGVRIEHRQQDIDRAFYGKYAGHRNLPSADYQLSYRTQERACYTFCMCPGGTVVGAASEEGGVVTNGMSNYHRDGENANSAMVVSVSPEDFENTGPLGAIAFQRKWESLAFSTAGSNYSAPIQTAGSFLGLGPNKMGRVRPTFTGGKTFCDLHECLPGSVTEMLKCGIRAFGKKIKGFDDAEAILTGVETRTSAPVRIMRGEDFQAIGIEGLFPCGEGAGYAGGIMSAAVDGLKIATSIIERYAPKTR
jgi:uncharacterized FAD-dependent dehydrogenase